MKMPGFTAETSLSEVNYRYALSLGHTEEGGVVLPQSVCWYCNEFGCVPRPYLIRAY
jgi:hypothetical protein